MFEFAEDSPQQLDAYSDRGDILVAAAVGRPVAHIQLIPTERDGEVEIKSMAVHPACSTAALDGH